MYMCMCLCMYMYMCLCMHMYMCLCMYMYMCMCVYVYMYMYMSIYIYISMYTPRHGTGPRACAPAVVRQLSYAAERSGARKRVAALEAGGYCGVLEATAGYWRVLPGTEGY
jgi:hypothetical protein